MNLWLLFICVGITTFILRAAFIEMHGLWKISPLLQRALQYVPISVLAALIAPAVFILNAEGFLPFELPPLLAASIATLTAWRFRNTFYSLLAGMGSLLLLQNILPLITFITQLFCDGVKC